MEEDKKKNYQIWSCKIGVLGDIDLPYGADQPMREAIQQAFYELTGRWQDICFSGWNAKLTEVEEKILMQDVENRKSKRGWNDLG